MSAHKKRFGTFGAGGLVHMSRSKTHILEISYAGFVTFG
jgi:ribosomal protein L35